MLLINMLFLMLINTTFHVLIHTKNMDYKQIVKNIQFFRDNLRVKCGVNLHYKISVN